MEFNTDEQITLLENISDISTDLNRIAIALEKVATNGETLIRLQEKQIEINEAIRTNQEDIIEYARQRAERIK